MRLKAQHISRPEVGHFKYDRPGDPIDSEPFRGPSQTSSMAITHVCQPLAISPFQRPCWAIARIGVKGLRIVS